jgi:hypothetical protein
MSLKPLDIVPGLHRFLVTGATEEEGVRFGIEVEMIANAVEAKGLTVFYTVPRQFLSQFIDSAERLKITVQQRVPNPPFWNLVVQGAGKEWHAEKAEAKS